MDIRDLANDLSVSIATVSRALRPETEHLVRNTLRSKIKDRAREINYVPNAGAQSLRMRKRFQVSVIISHREEIFLSEYHVTLLVALLTSAKHYSLDLRLDFIREKDTNLMDALQSVSYGTSGIIYMGSALSEKDALALPDLNRPFSILRSSLPPHIKAASIPGRIVGVDNVHAGYIATKHLLDNGHRDIAFVTSKNGNYDIQSREIGYKKALEEYGVTFEPSRVIGVTLDFSSGFKAWEQLKSPVIRPTAVICGNDELARGLIKAANTLRPLCPNDLAVVGFDDSRLAYFADPTLTSVKQPLHDVGWALVDSIFQLIKNEWSDDEIHDEQIYTPVLVIRESTAGRKTINDGSPKIL